MSKRGHSPPASSVVVKRSRAEPEQNTQQLVISSAGDDKSKGLVRTVKRTSNLEAPIISLSGAHAGEILSCRFDPTGQNIAACSTDRCVSLWRTYPPNTNYGQLTNIHKTAVTDLQWSFNSPLLYTVSADSTLMATDLSTGIRVRKVRAHKGVVNAVDRSVAAGGGMELIATCGDDGLLKIWESPNNDEFSSSVGKRAIAVHEMGCPITSLAFSQDGQTIYLGALDNQIHIYDVRKQSILSTLTGHTNTPTSLSLSPSGSFLLSPSLSSQTIIFDIRPFSPTPNRIHRILQGSPAGFENPLLRGAWSREDGGSRVGVGGSDRTVTIWDVESGKIAYKLPGHKGTVMAVDFHPKEPIVLTGAKDGVMLLGEIEPGLHV